MRRLKTLSAACFAILTLVTLHNLLHSVRFKSLVLGNRHAHLNSRNNTANTTQTIFSQVKEQKVEIHTDTSSNNAHRTDKPQNTSGGSREVQHIAFLKVHKAGSSTVQNILYRFGLARNLTFVLPEKGHYLSKSKYQYAQVLPLSKDKSRHGRFDILCNHAVFNFDQFKQFLYPDTEYFAIVRQPLDLFISAAYYYRYVWPSEYLTRLSETTFIQTLIQYPEKYEEDNVIRSRTFNYMTRDFGFVLKSVNGVKTTTDAEFKSFLHNISNIFKIVLVMERFDESLVLLKRHFRWSLKDIMYLKNNAYRGKSPKITARNLTTSDMRAFNKSHWMDIQLYEHFSERLEKQIKKEVNFDEEVQCFREYLRDIQKYCSNWKKQKPDHTVLRRTRFSHEFTVHKDECKLMALEELKFYRKLVERHKQIF